nr:rho GTPase-activating protein SYDE2-like [Anolis sagrei ordinatus]
MSNRAVGQEAKEASTTTALLDCLPEAEKATLTMLLDHLSLVASFHASNRMNAQNLAVCFGPVLLSQGAGGAGARSPRLQHRTITSTMDFKNHIEVLHYLLQAWPSEYYLSSENTNDTFDNMNDEVKAQYKNSIEMSRQDIIHSPEEERRGSSLRERDCAQKQEQHKEKGAHPPAAHSLAHQSP